MIIHQLKLIIPLKLTIWKRTVREISPVHLVLLSIFALAAGWALLKADIPVTWRSLSVAAMLQLLVCTRLKYPDNKKELLSQYPELYPAALLTDTLLTTLPFLLAHILFWFAAIAVALPYTLLSVQKKRKTAIKLPALPSPFFPKSAYLWHSQFRMFLPAVWLFIAAISVIARVHGNFNLAIVVYDAGVFISVITVMLQKEESDFIGIYLNAARFRKRTTEETLAAAAIFALPPAVLLLPLFPSEWPAIALSFLSILLVGVNVLWIKYSFYPSMVLASLFFFVGIVIQAILAISPYGLALIPFYHLGLYHFFKQRTHHCFTENERTDY